MLAIGAENIEEDFGDGGEGGDGDLLADLDGCKNFGEIGILAYLDAMGEGEFEDPFGKMATPARQHARCRLIALAILEGNGNLLLSLGRRLQNENPLILPPIKAGTGSWSPGYA